MKRYLLLFGLIQNPFETYKRQIVLADTYEHALLTSLKLALELYKETAYSYSEEKLYRDMAENEVSFDEYDSYYEYLTSINNIYYELFLKDAFKQIFYEAKLLD